MKTLPANIILEKNKIATANPWLVLLDITLTDDTNIYLVNNTEDIVFQGRVYTAIAFKLDPTNISGSGKIPSVQLSISNVTRVLQAYLEALEGAVDSEITITVVNAALLAENYAELQMTFSVLSTKADAYFVVFTLGAPNPLRKRFPLHRYIAEHCNWKFLARECNYGGWQASYSKYKLNDLLVPLDGNGDAYGYKYKCTVIGTTGASQPAGFATGVTPVTDGGVTWTKVGTQLCKRTFDECTLLLNDSRFGGYPGLGGGKVKYV